MQSFQYYTPTEIVFGKGTEKKAGELVKKYGGKKVFLVYGGESAVKSGLLSRIEDELTKEGLLWEAFGGVKPNPRLSHAREGVKRAVEFGADFLLAVGGGSVIDTAKAIAHGTANPEVDIWDFWIGEKVVEKTLPVGCVLTISAAGSEMSNSSVLTNEETGQKIGLNMDLNRPVFAVMNPELTFTLPQYQISCGIVDIMMHTLDRYFTHTKGNETTDEMAEAILRVVIRNGRKAKEDSHDYEAMSELMWCGSLSHNGLTGLGAETDFAPHKLGHELSAKFDMAHGASLAAVWGSWAQYVCPMEPERFARYGEKVWGVTLGTVEERARAGIEKTVEYFRSLGMPTCFSEADFGILKEEVIKELARRCSFDGTRQVGSFKKLGQKEMYEIYTLCNH